MADARGDVMYGVILIGFNRSEQTHPLRFEVWVDAANFGEEEVKAKRAIGFKIFKDKQLADSSTPG